MSRVALDMKTTRPKYVDLKMDVVADCWHVIEPKMDGQWATVIVKDCRMQIWSRHGKLKHECNVVAPDMVLAGEYLIGSHWAHKRGLDGQLYVFDMWELAGKSFKNVPLVKRRESLKRKLGAFGFPEWVKLTPQYDAQTWETHWNSLVLERGFEGLVFKRNDVVLANAIWGRMKRTVTVDYVCLGGNPGGGRYAGKACSSVKGGLLVDGKVVPIASVSGLNDLLRVELFEGQHVGRVFEAEGKGVYANGALRHPNFVRWRDDKMPEECVMPTSTM